MSTTITVRQQYGPVLVTVWNREYDGGGSSWEFSVWRGNRLLHSSARQFGREVDALAGAWSWVSDQDDFTFLESVWNAETWRPNDYSDDAADDDTEFDHEFYYGEYDPRFDVVDATKPESPENGSQSDTDRFARGV
jgi:hypothetical protein